MEIRTVSAIASFRKTFVPGDMLDLHHSQEFQVLVLSVSLYRVTSNLSTVPNINWQKLVLLSPVAGILPWYIKGDDFLFEHEDIIDNHVRAGTLRRHLSQGCSLELLRDREVEFIRG